MNATPVTLLTCTLAADGLTGGVTLTVRVPRVGRFKKTGGRYPATDRVAVYAVKVTPRFVFLTKENGELVSVAKTGGCSCEDRRWRERPTRCKHELALRKVGLLGGAT